MSAVMTAPEITAGCRCRMDEVFSSPFIELLGLAPQNPVVRGLILAQTGKMPGPEHTTFEQIRVWVEANCEKKVRAVNQPPTRSTEGITITVEFSETEYGRADYSVPRSGSDEFTVDADELLEMIQESVAAGEGLEEVVNQVASLIDDDAWNRCDHNMDDCGDYNYSEHDSNDSDSGAIQYSRAQIKEHLRVFLRERHPQLLEELV